MIDDVKADDGDEIPECTHNPFRAGCDICERMYSTAKAARQGEANEADFNTDYETLNSDLIILNEADCNGNVAIYHTVGRRGKVGYASGMRNKMSATSAREEAIARTWMLHVARSGGRIDYRIHGTVSGLIPPAIIIQVSTGGTLDSDNWCLRLA